jgi:hypothetical protein
MRINLSNLSSRKITIWLANIGDIAIIEKSKIFQGFLKNSHGLVP